MGAGSDGALDRGSRVPDVVAFVCVLAILAGIARNAYDVPAFHGDSAELVLGSTGITHCLAARHFTNCNELLAHWTARDAVSDVGPFPLLQYLIAVPLQVLGVSKEWTLRLLVWVSFASLVTIFALVYGTLRRLAPPLWAPLATLAILASPLLAYGQSPYGEELAAAVILAAIVSVLVGARLGMIAVLVVLAGVTKETNPPFVFALAAICVLARTQAGDPVRWRRLAVITIGTATSIVLNFGFNLFRYGRLGNAVYTRSQLFVPNVPTFGRLFVAQWLAPNGGLLWFWPLALAFTFGLSVVALRRRQSLSWSAIATPVLALLLVGQVALLSTWWAPFGWYAWGPRLILPIIPALVVAGSTLAAPYATPLVARVLRSRLLPLLAAGTIAIGLAQIEVVFHGLAVSQFFARAICRGSLEVSKTAYYRCLNDTAWTKRPWMLQLGMHGLDSARGWLAAVLFVVAVAALLYMARRAAYRVQLSQSVPEYTD